MRSLVHLTINDLESHTSNSVLAANQTLLVYPKPKKKIIFSGAKDVYKLL